MPRRTVNRSEMEPYRRTVDEILNAFDTSAQTGLRRQQAQERLERYGKNELATEASVPAWRKFLGQFTDILVVLLIVAALISAGLWLYERDSAVPYEAMAILAIVLLNGLMGYLQQAAPSTRWRRCARCRRRTPTSYGTAPDRASWRASSCPATSYSSKRATPCLPTRG